MTEIQDQEIEDINEILSTVSSYKRVYTFLKIQDKKPKYIAVDLDVTRNALQHYITDWKELGLLGVDGNEYFLTEKGKRLKEYLRQLPEQIQD